MVFDTDHWSAVQLFYIKDHQITEGKEKETQLDNLPAMSETYRVEHQLEYFGHVMRRIWRDHRVTPLELISAIKRLLGKQHSTVGNRWGDWKRGTGHHETIKIVGTNIARLDNAAPYSKGGHRETWQCGTRSNIGVHFLCCMEME